ncbi:MAG: phosphoenolpyruvate carboxylase, partial [Asticcacaulis sp.]
MTDTTIDHVRQNIAMLEGFLTEAVHEFGKVHVLSKIDGLKSQVLTLKGLSESEAAHAARLLTCLSALTVISEDVANLARIETFEDAEGNPQPISLVNAVTSARLDGYTQAEIEDTLRGILASPVFTAHPTEMRRASIVEREYEITSLLAKYETANRPIDRKYLEEDLYRAVALLFNTRLNRPERISVADEVQNSLGVVKRSILPALTELYT